MVDNFNRPDDSSRAHAHAPNRLGTSEACSQNDAKPNEQASPRLHLGTSVRFLHGVYESIKILYEAGKDIERAINR